MTGLGARPGMQALGMLLERLQPGELFPNAENRRKEYEKWYQEKLDEESKPGYVRPTRGEFKDAMMQRWYGTRSQVTTELSNNSFLSRLKGIFGI